MFTSRFLTKVATVMIILMMTLSGVQPAQAAESAQAITFHSHVLGVAELLGSTCPDFGDWVPEVDTLCDGWHILYYLEGEPSELREQPWRLFVLHSVVIVHPDGTVTVLDEPWGEIQNPQGSFDLKAYTYARVSGMVPMSDGSEVPVELTWDMALAELRHGGNNSIANVSNGIDRHYNDRCLTQLQLAHQQWRAGAPGQISGSIGGVDVSSFFLHPLSPFIAGRSVFTFVIAEHGGCAA